MKRAAYILLTLSILSCEDPELLTSVETIKYGTSFGMCAGYCVTETTVSPEEIHVLSSGWNNSVAAEGITSIFTKAGFDDLIGKIDAEAYLSLSPVIGCPDCADGGAEWIELSLDGRVKRVTFPYGAEVEGIHEAIETLRALTEQLKAQ